MKKVLPHFSFLTRAKPSTDSDWDGARIILTHEGKQRASESTRERERVRGHMERKQGERAARMCLMCACVSAEIFTSSIVASMRLS